MDRDDLVDHAVVYFGSSSNEMIYTFTKNGFAASKSQVQSLTNLYSPNYKKKAEIKVNPKTQEESLMRAVSIILKK